MKLQTSKSFDLDQHLKGLNVLTSCFFFLASSIGASGAVISIDFDSLPDGSAVQNQFASLGVVFSSPSASGAPVAYGFFPSHVSSPNYLLGENEGQVDLNPGLEFGNNQPAVPITITFVDAGNPAAPAFTDFVAFNDVFTNIGAVTRAQAFDLDGGLLSSQSRAGLGGSNSNLFSFSIPGIHELVITFGAPGSVIFEDFAAIDDLRFNTVEPVPEPSRAILLLFAVSLSLAQRRRRCKRSR